MAKNLYVRVKPKGPVTEFYRCGIKHTLQWVPLADLDDATAERLQNEQMLETSETKPEGFDDQAESPAEPAANETPDETKLPESDALLANIADLTKEVAELEEALTARDEVIAELKAALEAKIAEVGALTDQVTALQSQLEALPKLAPEAAAPAEAAPAAPAEADVAEKTATKTTKAK